MLHGGSGRHEGSNLSPFHLLSSPAPADVPADVVSMGAGEVILSCWPWEQSLCVVQAGPEFELVQDAERQPGLLGWVSANFRPHVCVDRYALFMGSIGGLVLSVLLLGVWVGLGTPMGYDNPNWLLIIGTFTGLVSCFAAVAYCLVIAVQEAYACKMDSSGLKVLPALKGSGSIQEPGSPDAVRPDCESEAWLLDILTCKPVHAE